MYQSWPSLKEKSPTLLRLVMRSSIFWRDKYYEAANVLLTRIEKWSALKAWGNAGIPLQALRNLW
jgi:hypothetical protein